MLHRMSKRSEIRILLIILAVFLAFYFVPLDHLRVRNALIEALSFAQDYARHHMVFGMLPAFLLAGAISTFVSKGALMKYLGAKARRSVSYAVASLSGAVLTVCSCTMLPIFAGVYSRGAGLGPAIAFLYAGPAINVMAILLTARVLGPRIGIARAAGAIGFSILIGLAMHLLFRREEHARTQEALAMPEPTHHHAVGQNLVFFAAMVGVLVFANWGRPAGIGGFVLAVHGAKWWLTAGSAAVLGFALVRWFGIALWRVLVVGGIVAVLSALLPDHHAIPFIAGMAGIAATARGGSEETRGWIDETWGLIKRILPLLLIGVLVSGLLLGRPGNEGLIPSSWIIRVVGGNSIVANTVAALAGSVMYFCTLIEVPIVQGLMGSGMGEGPALAFLLAGPAVSLPNILVLRSVIGGKKTAVYIVLVVATATAAGLAFGSAAG